VFRFLVFFFVVAICNFVSNKHGSSSKETMTHWPDNCTQTERDQHSWLSSFLEPEYFNKKFFLCPQINAFKSRCTKIKFLHSVMTSVDVVWKFLVETVRSKCHWLMLRSAVFTGHTSSAACRPNKHHMHVHLELTKEESPNLPILPNIVLCLVLSVSPKWSVEKAGCFTPVKRLAGKIVPEKINRVLLLETLNYTS